MSSIFIYPPTPVNVSTPPIEILVDAVPTQIEEDTVDETSSVPMPANLYFDYDGAYTKVRKDTVTASNTRALPVSLVDVTGVDATFNVTTGDLNIAITHDGVAAAFDSTRIGDGTNIMAVNASLEATVNDADLNSALGQTTTPTQTNPATDAPLIGFTRGILTGINSLNTSFSAEDFATETTLAAIQTHLVDNYSFYDVNLTAGAGAIENVIGTNLRISSTGGSIEAKGRKVAANSIPAVLSTEDKAVLDSIAAEDFATETTLAALNTAFGAEDFASETTLAALNTAFAAEDFASETTLAAMSAKLPSVIGRNAEADSISVTISDEDKAVLDVIADGTSKDMIDHILHDCVTTPITTAAAGVTVLTMPATAGKEISVICTFGTFMELMINGTAVATIPKGGLSGMPLKVAIPALATVGFRSLSGVSITTGEIVVNIMG